MAALPQTWISPDEYLARESEAEYKSEYVDGVVHAMAGASPLHNLIALNVGAELRSGLRGGPCLAYASDLKVATPNRKRLSYPDASVICGEPALVEGRKDVVTNPTVLIEVLSEGTAGYDRGPKFLAYQSIPGLQEYVLVSQDEPRVECYRRQGDGWFYTRVEGLDGALRLHSVGCELKLSEVYLGVTWPGVAEDGSG